MALTTGSKLGPYEITGTLGAGGMGEVYRAHDPRLNRQVAVKVLPVSFSSDQDRLRRFQQEAMATAALNDPGIVAVYDVGAQDGFPYVVSELLEGETLRDRLRNGALPRRKAIEYGIQIARALAVAHDKGIVHRDLKPENIFVTREGRTKILDFGLAKLAKGVVRASAVTAAIGSDEPSTQEGMIVGTVGYMSPEQVRGLPAEARSDIFALGATLYEMLSGQRAFRGKTPADTISAILKEDPPELVEAGRDISPALERIVRHCLEKSPEERFRSAHDVAFALENVAHTSQSTVALASAPKPWPRGKLALFVAALLLAVLAGGAFLAWRGLQRNTSPNFHTLTFERGIVQSARFTPDGQSVIYGARWESRPLRLFSTPYNSLQPRPLELESASLLGISRSGEMALATGGILSSHLMVRNATLARAPLAGGTPREVLEQVTAADWGPDDTLAVVHNVSGRSRVEYPIGKVLYESGGWISHLRISPSGKQIAFMVHPSSPDDRGFVAMVDATGKVKRLTEEWQGEEGLAWTPDGKEIWFTAVSAGTERLSLLAVTPSGKVRTLLRIAGGITIHDIAADGRVLLSTDDERVGMRGARPGGPETELSWLGWTISEGISPDGKWVLFSEESEPAGSEYIVGVRSFDGAPPKRLGEGNGFGFSPDGKWVAQTAAGREPHITLLPTAAGQPQKIDVTGLEHVSRASFFPDGKRLILYGAEPGHVYRTYALDIAGGKPSPLTPEGVVSLVLSHDGKELAAQDLSGSITVYSLERGTARSVPGTKGMLPLQWSVDDHSLFTTVPDELPARILRVDSTTGRQELLRKFAPSDLGGVYQLWFPQVTADGKTYAYSYRQTLSRLYVVEGLH